MKTKYIITLVIAFLLTIIFGLLIYFASKEKQKSLGNALQITSVLAAGVAVIIALHGSDHKRKRVKAKIEHFISKEIKNWEVTYNENELDKVVKKFFEICPKPIKSYKVQFEITNDSDFDWINPTVTFRLPIEKQHPQKKIESDQKYSGQSYNSNTYNSTANLRQLEMLDGIIISNSNLPYWRHKTHLTIWIKMVLENLSSDPFNVQIFVDCENAEGYQEEIVIKPKMLIKNIKQST